MSEPILEYVHEYERNVKYLNDKSKDTYIDPFRTTVTFIQGGKGEGKSSFNEFFATVNYEAGHTVIDVLSAENYESCFYHICLDCKKYWDDKLKNDPKAVIPDYHCNCDKRYKVMLVVPDYVQIDQEALDANPVNHKYYTKKEWREAHPEAFELPTKTIKNPDGTIKVVTDMPIHPEYQEWVKVKKITIPNKGFKNRDRFVEQLTSILLTARDERRIISLNPIFFADKNHKFRALEQIIREIGKIMQHHFKTHTPMSVALKRGETKPIPFSQWTPEEINHHRVTLVLREFGSVAPSGLKGEAQETLVKKALLNIIRLVRQYHLTLIADFQRHADIIPSIRDQRDYFIFKATNPDMFPMENGYKWLWDAIVQENQRLAMQVGQQLADKICPTIDNLKPDQMVVVFPKKTSSGKMWKIIKAQQPRFHHRQEDDDYELITGIAFGRTWRFITQDESGEIVESVKNDIQEDKKVQDATKSALFDTVHLLMNPTDPKIKPMKSEEAFQHCKNLKLIPDGWKSSANLRKFMSREYKKRSGKPSSEDSE